MKFLFISGVLALALPVLATPVKGTYNGLFSETATNAQQISGAITITTTTKGTFTGKLQLGATRASFKGAFDSGGNASVTLKIKNSGSLKLQLSLDPAPTPDVISGTISDGTWTSQIVAKRAAFDGKTELAPQAGRYTLVIPGRPGFTTAPAGSGYATISVTKSG